MSKSPDAFRTISEVAEWLGVQAHVLRFWESKFAQVKPVKRAGGRRYYRPADMLLLGGLKQLLHEDGLTIKGAQKLLREKGVPHVSDMSQPLDDLTTAEIEGKAAEAEADVMPEAPQLDLSVSLPTETAETEISPPPEAFASGDVMRELDSAAEPRDETAEPAAPPEPPDTLPTQEAMPTQEAISEPADAAPVEDSALVSSEDAPEQTEAPPPVAEQEPETVTETEGAASQDVEDAMPSEPVAAEDADDAPPLPSFRARPRPAPQTPKPDAPPQAVETGAEEPSAPVPDPADPVSLDAEATEPEIATASENSESADVSETNESASASDEDIENAELRDAPEAVVEHPEAALVEDAQPQEAPSEPALSEDTPAIVDAADTAASADIEETEEIEEAAAEPAPAPKPRIIEVDPVPDYTAFDVEPAALAALQHVTHLTPEQAHQIKPLLARLTRLHASMARHENDIGKDG